MKTSLALGLLVLYPKGLSLDLFEVAKLLRPVNKIQMVVVTAGKLVFAEWRCHRNVFD